MFYRKAVLKKFVKFVDYLFNITAVLQQKRYVKITRREVKLKSNREI